MGSKHHVITEGQGLPLAFELSGANRHDITEAVWLIEAIPAICGKVGRPRHLPESVYADRAYHSQAFKDYRRGRRIKPFIAERFTEHGSGLGTVRWVVERTIAWLHQFR